MSTSAAIPRRIDPSITGVFEHAWSVLTTRFWPMMGLVLGVIVVALPQYAVNMAANLMTERLRLLGLALSFGAMGYSFFIMTPAQYGMLRGFARAARGDSVGIEDFIAPFTSLRTYVSVLANTLVLMLICFAILLPVLVVACLAGVGGAVMSGTAGGQSEEQAAAAALAAAGGGLVIAMLACAVPLIWVACRLMFAQVLVTDAGCGPVQAITRSWSMTRGHALTVFLIMLCSIPLALAGLLAFCVGLVPACALIALTMSSLYVALGGGPGQAQAQASYAPPPQAPYPPPLPPAEG